MTKRRRVGLAGLAAMMVIGLGLVVLTRSRTNADAPGAQVKALSTPRATATQAHSERRTQLDRSGWTPAHANHPAGWVGVVTSALVETDATDAAAPHRSRAPPS